MQKSHFMKSKIPAFIFLTICLSFLASCKNAPIEPEQIYKPGRRDYDWKTDSLYMPMNVLQAIWGSSPDDVWAVGPGGDYDDKLQHYDGNKWTPYTIDGGSPCNGQALFGFSRNDVWMGGSDGIIAHFNGSKWTKAFQYGITSYTQMVQIMNIWGNRPDDIYACGSIIYKNNAWEPEAVRGLVLHYDGNKWTEVCKGEYNYQFLRIRTTQDKVFILGYSLEGKGGDLDKIAFYELSGNKLIELGNFLTGNVTFANFDLFGDTPLFWVGREVYRYKTGKIADMTGFSKFLSINEPNFYYNIFGRSEKDMFIVNTVTLSHYNGDDVRPLVVFPRTQIFLSGPMIFENDVFLMYYDYATKQNMVLHGKLKH